MSFRRHFLILGFLVPGALGAQTPDSLAISPPRRLAASPIRWWHVGLALGGTALLSTLDDDLQHWTVEHRGTTAQDVAKTWERWGDGRVLPIISLGTIATGVAIRKPAVTRLGGRLAASFIVAAAISRGTKRGLGRARPSEGEGQYDFDPWSDQSAFPSGHTTNAFVLSATLADAIDDRRVDVALYALAAGTGASRVINNRHWLSDVVGGALLGTTVAKVIDGKWRLGGLRPPEFLVGPGGTGLRWTAELPRLRSPRGDGNN